MSIAPLAKQSMRILALPLVSAMKASESAHLIYYHFVTPPPRADKSNTWAQWATDKAAGLWADFGKAEDGTLKQRTFRYGERIIDRIDFEELALKSLDPSLGPKMTGSESKHSETNMELEDKITIPLIYPDAACSSPLAHLRDLLSERGPKHKRDFYMWMAISPLTAPLKLIPIIPNLPFFYCVWRSWSHFRASKTSSYLQQLLEKDAIVPHACPELSEIYAKYAPVKQSSAPSNSEHQNDQLKDPDRNASFAATSESDVEQERHLLLTREAVPAITALFDSRPDSPLAANMYRALEQAALRLRKAQSSTSSG